MLSRRREQYRYVGDRMEGQAEHPLQRIVRADRVAVHDATEVFVCSDPMVMQAMRYIASNVEKDLQIVDLVKHLNSSRSTLHRRFIETLGRSASSEIRLQRVSYLKRLLTEKDRTLGDISAACGFSSPSHFTRYFKRETGVTPSEYRCGKIVPTSATSY